MVVYAETHDRKRRLPQIIASNEKETWSL